MESLGRLEFEMFTFQIPDDPDLKLMLYTAAPDTAAKLARRLGAARVENARLPETTTRVRQAVR